MNNHMETVWSLTEMDKYLLKRSPDCQLHTTILLGFHFCAADITSGTGCCSVCLDWSYDNVSVAACISCKSFFFFVSVLFFFLHDLPLITYGSASSILSGLSIATVSVQPGLSFPLSSTNFSFLCCTHPWCSIRTNMLVFLEETDTMCWS